MVPFAIDDMLFFSGGQTCIENADVQSLGIASLNVGRLALTPRLEFSCDGRITRIRARVVSFRNSTDFPSFQVWRPSSSVSDEYSNIGETYIQSHDQVISFSDGVISDIFLTGDNRIEFQSGDIVGYYHPPDSNYRVRHVLTRGYVRYTYLVSSAPTSVDLTDNDGVTEQREPLIEFTYGKW